LNRATAEPGVYQGSSDEKISEAKRDRPLYLCDTFSGLPECGADLPGAALAFNEYLTPRHDAVIESPTTQAMVVVRAS
jgi:hypothetical protein